MGAVFNVNLVMSVELNSNIAYVHLNNYVV